MFGLKYFRVESIGATLRVEKIDAHFRLKNEKSLILWVIIFKNESLESKKDTF